jgi:hypothetical protein
MWLVELWVNFLQGCNMKWLGWKEPDTVRNGIRYILGWPGVSESILSSQQS